MGKQYLQNNSYYLVDELEWTWHAGPNKKGAFELLENMAKEYPNHKFHVEFFSDGKWTVVNQ